MEWDGGSRSYKEQSKMNFLAQMGCIHYEESCSKTSSSL